MKYPALVPERICQLPVHVVIYGEGIDENGAPIVLAEDDLKCNYKEKLSAVMEKDRKVLKAVGKAYFSKDHWPDIEQITGGKITVHGADRSISYCIKARNPDQTVNHVEMGIE